MLVVVIECFRDSARPNDRLWTDSVSIYMKGTSLHY